MTTRIPFVLQRRERCRCRRLHRVGNRQDSGRPAIDADEDRGRAVVPLAVGGLGERNNVDALLTEELRIAERNTMPFDDPEGAFAGRRVELLHRRDRKSTRPGRGDDGEGEGARSPGSTAAARRRISVSGNPSAGRMAVTAGLPSVSVPVLSTTSVSTFSMVSRASAFLISTPAGRRGRPRP